MNHKIIIPTAFLLVILFFAIMRLGRIGSNTPEDFSINIQSSATPLTTSLSNLLKHQDYYNHKMVKIRGFCRKRNEYNEFFLNPYSGYTPSEPQNAILIWINNTTSIQNIDKSFYTGNQKYLDQQHFNDQLENLLNHKYVEVIGMYMEDSKNLWRDYQGLILNVTLLKVLQNEED